MKLAEKQEQMKARHPVKRGRPFAPKVRFDLGDVQAKLRVFYLRARGFSIARVAAATGAEPLWIARWEEKGCPLM